MSHLIRRIASTFTQGLRRRADGAVDPDGRASIDHVSDVDAAAAGQAAPAGAYRLTALIIASSLFMENLDATVLTTALPTMARDFGVRAPELSVTVTAYLLAIAVFIPASGYVADRWGTQRVFSAALLIFVAGSIACGLAPTLELMAASRFLQGMGGAMMVPVGRLILLRTVPKRDLVAAQSWLLMPGLLGTILGPPVGGFIVTYVDWRWIFWINLPIGLAGVVLVRRFIPNFRQAGRSFDGRGFVLSAIALAALLFGFELVGPASEPEAGAAMILAGLFFSGAYLLHARRKPGAILDVSLLRVPTFRLALIGGSLIRITQGAQPFLLSMMLQFGFGYSAIQSGSITLATAVGTFTMKSQVTRILRAFGFRRSLIVIGILGPMAYALCGFFRPDWPLPAIFGVLFLAGFLMSFQFTAYNTLAYDEIGKERMASAASFYSTFQQLTLSLGVCTAATVLQLAMIAGDRETPALSDVSLAFWIVTGVSFCALFSNLRFSEKAGAELRGAR